VAAVVAAAVAGKLARRKGLKPLFLNLRKSDQPVFPMWFWRIAALVASIRCINRTLSVI
jgi:hypothetical protein